ncbi:methyltransferase [Lentzea flava]|uniref:Methyltransferase n=1 Tax=Lentzea flava TaxID=103732 RepID=A0ABQ2UGC5_9PSEU|nr:methyltransferase [Lentzea flava]MCP2198977.1 O-methyltransferase [Lentzea flava]GGU32528.1 methyltransferase [Lentzea flava]
MADTTVVDDYFTLVDDSCVAVLPHVLRIAAELRIADHLPASASSLASVVDADTDAVYRLLRALASVGVVSESGGSFELTERGQRLTTSWASLVNIDSQLAWIKATDTIRSGRSSFDQVHRGEFFSHKDDDPEANRMFLRRMRERASRSYPEFASCVDWSESSVVMDIGGGDGYLIGTVLAHAQHLSGVLFDRPATVDVVEDAGVPARLRCERGDFFEKVAPGADTHLMCSVLHDWTDEQCTQILRHSKEALEPGGRLHIVEMIVPDGDEWHPSKWSDVGMMVLTGGKERTLPEFSSLLEASGYALRSVRAIPNSYFSVITAV